MIRDTDHPPSALAIAGSDSGGGAGIQADLKTFAAFGVYGTTAITAVTAQNTSGVGRWEAVSPALVRAQVESVLDDIGADAVKIGMLPTAEVVVELAGVLGRRAVTNVVLDPLLVATTGASLTAGDTRDAILRDLLPLTAVVTPNRTEAEALTGVRIATWSDARDAAARLVELGARSVVLTGGGVPGEDSARDLFFDGNRFREYTAVLVQDARPHGAGCTFSSGIAAGLAKEMRLEDAIALAKSYVTLAIQHAFDVGGGLRPLHHFYRYYQPAGPKYRPGVAVR